MTTPEPISAPIRQMQIVVAGLTVSPVLFALFTIFIPITPLAADAAKLLTTIGLVVGLVVLLTYQWLGQLVTSQAVVALEKASGEADPPRLAGAYLSGLLVAAALCEGGAFVNLIAFWVTRSPWNLALAAMLVTTALTRFPTERKVTAWMQRQKELRPDADEH